MEKSAHAGRVTRDVDPAALQDLLQHPPRATIACVHDGAPELLPARAIVDAGTYRFGVIADVAPDLDGREVVLVVDDGPYWFQLRGVSMRGIARRTSQPAAKLAWYAIEAKRVLAWDYATVRPA